MLHFSQNHTYLPDRFKSNFLWNFPFPRDQKAAHCHTMQCWHSGVSIIAMESILWRLDDLKVLTMSKYTMQSTVSSQPPRQICTHFRLFCSPPPRESRVSGYSWRSQLELPSVPLRHGLTWPVVIPTVYQTPVTVHGNKYRVTFSNFKNANFLFNQA